MAVFMLVYMGTWTAGSAFWGYVAGRQGTHFSSDSFPEAKGDLGSFCSKEVIAELTNDVVAGGLSIQNLHERRPVLCSARSASVRLLTELQNSSSVSCFEASPSASRASSSSVVPAKPGTVRCSTAVKAASTTSSTDL